jgi:hypothetical protein
MTVTVSVSVLGGAEGSPWPILGLCQDQLDPTTSAPIVMDQWQ